MITHYYTLLALSRELNAILRGCRVTEIFTQQKNELWISFDSHSKSPAGHTTPSLCISIDPKFNYCFLRDGITRAKKNSADLFPDLIGVSLENVTTAPFDRVLQIGFAGDLMMHILLYNTSQSNLLLTDEKNVIREAFKNDKKLRETPYLDTAGRRNAQHVTDAEAFGRAVTTDPLQSIFAALKRAVPMLGSTLAREILHRAKIEEKQPVGQLPDTDIDTIHQHLLAIMEEASSPAPRIYVRGHEARVFSLIQLSHLSGCEAESYPTVNDGIRSFIINTFRTHGFDTEKKNLLGKLKSERDRSLRSLEMMTAELEDTQRALQYERMGKLLTANIHQLAKGVSNIDLPDIFTDNAAVRISLDPKLSPSQNAERYFEKAKKAKTSRIELERRRIHAQKKTALLETMLIHLDNCHTTEQLKEFKSNHAKELTTMKITRQHPQKDLPPFRMFTVAGGFEVWVGKSSANNDLLTMKYARPNDLWFHARGAGGSHTVLKIHGSELPTKQAIQQAASIAAYYSKMRKASNVPVAYCERKYVRKPRHAAEGSVVLEREKVVFVAPRLPVARPESENS